MADILDAAQSNTQSPLDPAPPVPEPMAPEPTTPVPSTDSLIVPPPPPSSPPPEQPKQKEVSSFEKPKPKSRMGALLAGLLLLVITLPILVVFVKQQMEIRSRATSAGTPCQIISGKESNISCQNTCSGITNANTCNAQSSCCHWISDTTSPPACTSPNVCMSSSQCDNAGGSTVTGSSCSNPGIICCNRAGASTQTCDPPDTCLPVSSCDLANRAKGTTGSCIGPYSCCGAVITTDNCAQGDTYCVDSTHVAACKTDKNGYTNTACATGWTCDGTQKRCIPPKNTCASLNQPCCASLGDLTSLNCQVGLTCNSSNICVSTSGGGTLTCECNSNTQNNCSSAYTGSPEKCVSGGCNSSGNNTGHWLSCSLTDACIYDNRVTKCVGTQLCDVPVGEMGWQDDSCKGKAGGTNTSSCALPHYCTTNGTCIKNGTCTPAGMSNTNCHTDPSCGGNTPTTTPTKTLTPTPTNNPQCISIIAYDKNGNALSVSELNALHVGDTITLAFAPGGAATKVHFRVNAGTWTESTTKNTNGQFTWTYTLENVTDFLIEAQWFDGTVWH